MRWRPAGPRLVLAFVALASCRSDRNVAVLFPNTPAYGRSETCPDGAIDPYGDGTVSPVATKCSYSDAIGDGVTRLGGKVLAEDGAAGRGVPDMLVTVHAIDGAGGAPGSGARVAETRTDAQGGFHLSAVLRPATYEIVAWAADQTPLSYTRLELHGARSRTIEDLRLIVPVDDRMR